MSRLSDVLNELSRAKRMNQPQIVQRSNDLGVPLSKGNVSRYLSGKHPEKPQPATLEAFAKVFDVPVSDLEEAATFTGNEPFVPDRSSDLLTPPQRTAVNEIIRLLADGNRKAGESGATSTSPMNQPGVRPADDWPHFDPDERTETEAHLRAREQLARSDYGLIADRGHSEGKRLADEAGQRGEESQDPDD